MRKNKDFLLSKTGYINFIKLVRERRLKTFGKRGIIKIYTKKIKKINDLDLRQSLYQLVRDGILKKIGKAYSKKEGNNLIVDCEATYEEIDEYINSLVIPGGYGLFVEPSKRGCYIIYKHGEKENAAELSEPEGKIINYLYKNKDREVKKEILCRKIGIKRSQISPLLNSVRRKLHTKLGIEEKKTVIILPKYTRGYNTFCTR